ncbi:vascular-related unknown protein 1-like [Gastrolobium bilobum]|uniref:vascular-related unknown protein 1-like n=1 Tax=Gastrolobium bilobum TaxID=150636 RepID=UPI002AAFAE84|nr:vascular-related unknown protein 1-like [Gastrolobium bilobum]
MDHSLNSSMGKSVPASANENPSYHEESGWTSYLEDFSKDMEPSSCSSFGGSSLVSDAASCAAWKFSHSVRVRDSSNNYPKKLCFKKTRTKQISEDDPLEDTASSPANSPKVGDLNPMEMVSRKIDDQLDGSRDKGFESKLKTDEGDLNFNGNNVECTDLKKRGLCLVPLSMLVNYYG